MACWIRLSLQILACIISCMYCQQFGPINDNPTPARFLVPGAIPVGRPLQQQQEQQLQPQPRRLPFNPQFDSSAPKLRRPPIIRPRVLAPQTSTSSSFEPELSPSSPRNFSPSADNPSIPPRPVFEVEEDEENELPTLSTVQPQTLNPTFTKTFRPPSSQFRPSKPQQIFTTTDSAEEDETDYQTTKPHTQHLSTPSFDDPRKFQRKQLTGRIPQPLNLRPQPDQDFFDKPKVQFEKPIRPQRVEKPETPVKREKKPVSQILRKYREDNLDGSISWGFENDDGSYKEETIGNDCVTRGKYGYIDPDGVRREYTYSTGLPCDKNKQEEIEAESNQVGYVDYSSNRVVLPNGDSVDLNNMVKNRARKTVPKFRN